jgi:hypothetical protein
MPAPAAELPDAWHYAASIYLYLPSVGGKSNVPADSAGTPIDLSLDQILNALQFTFMGAFDASNGRWGGYTDFVYLDFAGHKQNSRAFTIGDIGLPVGTTADLDWSLRGLAWTIGGEYRAVADGGTTMDVLAGARLLDIETTSAWNITGDIGPLQPAGRTGRSERRTNLVDGIVGAKGAVALGESSRWALPYYVDVGTGQSKLTWQAAAGVRYGYDWGDLVAMWRYLSYDMKSGYSLAHLNFNGPMFGATFRW